MTSAGDMSIFLHDNVIHGHYFSKDTRLQTLSSRSRSGSKNATPIKRMRLINNSLRLEEDMSLINNVRLIARYA